MSEFLRISNLNKNFGKLAALQDISLNITQGEIVGLIGPNGAGKTTLFNVITGFFNSTSGQIIFKGQDVSKSSPNKLAEMGMIRTFQIPRPFRELTVRDNVAVGTLFNPKRINSQADGSVEDLVDRILKSVNLYHLSNQPSAVLGYGNLKLLELGRAQGPCPELLLLDEPFAGLTFNEIQSVIEIIKNLTKCGLTMIIVEHKLRELMKLVNRVIVLHYGQKIADGMPEEVMQNEQVLKAYLGRRWFKTNVS